MPTHTHTYTHLYICEFVYPQNTEANKLKVFFGLLVSLLNIEVLFISRQHFIPSRWPQDMGQQQPSPHTLTHET